MKKRLTQNEEFEIMKLVLDKFLWVGTLVMLYGLFTMIMGNMSDGLLFMIAGIVVLVLFMVLIVKEYEVIR